MAMFGLFAFVFLFSFSPATITNANAFSFNEGISSEGLKTYIVHVKRPESTVFGEQSLDLESWYKSFLPVSMASSNMHNRMVYSYRNVVSGFAARLTEDEVKAMEKKDGFIVAHPERIFQLKTTHTPNFLGLFPNTGFWKGSNFGKGMIVGVLDGGIFPSHPSFSDKDMPPPPAKWKGRCDFDFPDCTNKLIGARSFINASALSRGAKADPPVDDDGHGTHTSSTAAGAFVQGADVLGNAYGTAAGMAPYAHVAMYKVCIEKGCSNVDILAGMDAAVEDGVDVLSLSIGGGSVPFYEDGIAVGAFGAIQKGIFVSCAAGNDGPTNSTLSNEAPWILTVGASTMDRSISAIPKLGNGAEFNGESLFQPKDFPSTLMPLIFAGASPNNESEFCGEGALNGMDVTGKIVMCVRGGDIPRIAKGAEVKRAGGAAMILMNDEANAFSTLADAHVLPAAHIAFADGWDILEYIKNSSNPMATITFKGTVIGMSSAPTITSFSSRGPSIQSPGILKPDIIGPGVNVLAAWPFPLENTTSPKPTFNIISGTSMSTPHLSGIATLLKSSHPDWSPAAIKSAMMTTADLFNLEGKPILDETLSPADIFATGSGHVNPSRANDPGLVYDIQPDDYIPYLCGLGYTSELVGVIAGRSIKCDATIPEAQLNYPSFSVTLGAPSQSFTRTVTNVGGANATYGLEIVAPMGVAVSVKPDKLYFSEVNQTMNYLVTFNRMASSSPWPFAQGFIKWVSPEHSVRSPISVTFE